MAKLTRRLQQGSAEEAEELLHQGARSASSQDTAPGPWEEQQRAVLGWVTRGPQRGEPWGTAPAVPAPLASSGKLGGLGGATPRPKPPASRRGWELAGAQQPSSCDGETPSAWLRQGRLEAKAHSVWKRNTGV